LVPVRWPNGHAALARVEPMLDAAGQWVGAALIQEPEPRRVPAAHPRAQDDAFASIHAEDPATAAAVGLARKVARSGLPILLLAETGCGKERFAEAIHRASDRRDGPFVPVNCGALAPELLAAELFGYGPGAFTGADRAGREGLLAAAEGGTLFLDEVADMPPAMQVALLRVLEDGVYQRVGERVSRRAQVRVLGATCRYLAGLVERGGFRRDLWFRLKGLLVRIPPLRERTDRLSLAQALLAQDGPPAPGLSSAFQAWILRYDWPGNVRELLRVLEVARVLSDGASTLELEHLPPDLRDEAPPPDALAAPDSWEAAQVAAIRRALESTAGNVSAAARRLGIARSTVYRVLGRQGA
jgi:transcriptional regulator with PAS, ATPase and Fis domain